MPGALQRLLPVLVRVQARLDDDLSLDALASDAGLSSYHHSSILDIALESGYQSHETFTRAFRRRFGVSPREYRSKRRYEPSDGDSSDAAELHEGCEISTTRVREFSDLQVAFLRHVGPYEQVPQELWDRLLEWAATTGLGAGRPGSPVLLGVAHDPPGITPSERLRFDAAIRVAKPFEPTGAVGFQVVPGGPYGVTTHVGPYATVERACRSGFERLAKLRRYEIQGLPAIEIYHATRINAAYALNQTDVCLPLRVK